uniref:DDE-1 domain-containing protein n=1 Tax=Strongyloides venezuelensis TaxID=75913 RepID=A0A0K0FZY3_STRVS
MVENLVVSFLFKVDAELLFGRNADSNDVPQKKKPWDLSFEVVECLTPCNSIVLLVGSNKCSPGQTISNFWLAFKKHFPTIPVLIKLILRIIMYKMR